MLALWNGVDPAARREYDAWHSREHVPERISVPGMIGARRYGRVDGPLPEYLTLYDLSDTGVLESAPYRKLLDNPTDWSRSMRPNFRGFMRLCGRRVASHGGGLGGALAAVVVDETVDLKGARLQGALAKLLSRPPFIAAHVIERDAGIAEVPFSIGGAAPEFPREGAILVESYGETSLHEAMDGLVAALADGGVPSPETTLTIYRLAHALDAAALDRMVMLHREDFLQSGE